ncbi:MAG TPA: MGMT family protein [Gaiellales bacterium]|jgi:methylated-DNA-protein-cysteine methyltransferase related protein|nr:MGMT family protein [Gaiellales bacterium]
MNIPPGFRIVAETSAFERSVAEMVRRVPAGTVASYGRIAAWLGKPEAARAVGGAMARSPDGVPAHRVVTSGGRLAPGWEREQAELLRAEGVRVWRGHVREPIPWWEGPQRRARSTRPGRSSG